MERVFFTQHKGKKILVIDASNCKHDESLAIITKAKKIIRSQLPNSVYTFTDTTNTAYNTQVAEAMKEYVAGNKPYVKAAASVGTSGLKQILYNALLKFSGRNIKLFNNKQQALDWLAGQ
ncbi:MAG TPA: hypothetical protein PLB14_04165 [Smithellaceae bacterium]|jgi:hypothetical protein|nr:hypothetical protein [Smithellaceae bacterium]